MLNLLAFGSAFAQPEPRPLRVLIDDNYPPYIMRGEKGELQGILVDQWRAFERETGVPVEIRAGDWGRMIAEMAAGEGDVLDTVFQTPEREKLFDFCPPYATIDVPIYVSTSISGVADIHSLKGFLVGVKAGDAAVDALSSAGIDTLKEYPSYEAVIEAAGSGEIHVFCVDEPPALYFIYRGGLADAFKRAFTLNSGEFHRAVRKGDAATAELVERGFSKIPQRELARIQEKWIGKPVIPARVLRLTMWIFVAVTALAVFFLGAALYLRFKVRQRTSQLRKAVDELSVIRSNLEALIKATPDILFVLDDKGRFLEVFAQSRAKLLMNPIDFLEKRIEDVMPPDVAKLSMEALSRAAVSGKLSSCEYSLEMAGGQCDFEARFVPMKDNRFFVMVRDVTRDKAIEAESIKNQKLESLGLFAGGIAHDFNNILAAVSGNITLARMVANDQARADEFLGKAESASIRARGLTDQLRTLARGGEPVREATDLARLARETAVFALSGQNCAIKVDEGPGPFIAMVDRGQMGQVIQNIVFNAVQAMPSGGIVRLSVSRECIDYEDPRTGPDPGDYVRISIADSGPGMPQTAIGNIFDPYYTMKKGGTGLGLSICHTIVRRHGGSIVAESAEGAGSVFTIRLPAMDRSHTNVDADADPAESSGLALPERALVMDDEAVLRDLMVNLLGRFGCRADAASNGLEGLELFKAAIDRGEPYGLVIADLTVPGGMGGAEMMKAMRETGAPFASIVMSGYAEKPVLSDYKSHGFDAFLKKPFTRSEFQRIARNLFGSKA